MNEQIEAWVLALWGGFGKSAGEELLWDKATAIYRGEEWISASRDHSYEIRPTVVWRGK